LPVNDYSTDGSVYDMYDMQTDIERMLPPGTPAAELEWTPVVSTLRQLVGEAQTIKDDRDSIERQLKEVKCDMGNQCTLLHRTDSYQCHQEQPVLYNPPLLIHGFFPNMNI